MYVYMYIAEGHGVGNAGAGMYVYIICIYIYIFFKFHFFFSWVMQALQLVGHEMKEQPLVSAMQEEARVQRQELQVLSLLALLVRNWYNSTNTAMQEEARVQRQELQVLSLLALLVRNWYNSTNTDTCRSCCCSIARRCSVYSLYWYKTGTTVQILTPEESCSIAQRARPSWRRQV
jgi:hypothetical protein